jgi:hypothetical protein
MFGHTLHIGTPYCGKRFLTRQIPTSCLPKSGKEECLNAEPLFLKLTDVGVLLKGIKYPLDITFKTKQDEL